MTANYPWYDSPWLGSYVQARQLIKRDYPNHLDEFTEAFEPLRTRGNFQVQKLEEGLTPEELLEAVGVVSTLKPTELEKQELLSFGRVLIHHHPYFDRLHSGFAGRISDAVNEAVEPSYSFLKSVQQSGRLPGPHGRTFSQVDPGHLY